MFRKILAAVDGSSLSERALPWVRALAGRRPVILMQVVEPIYGVEGPRSSSFDDVSAAERYLQRLSRDFDPPAKIAVRVGSVVPTILDAAKDLGADLVAITTHGSSMVARQFFGGTAEKMMYNSDLPLLIVPSHPDIPSTSKVERVVVPLDGSRMSEMILPLAKDIAREHQAELILAHAVTAEGDAERAYTKTGIDSHLRDLTVRLSKAGLCTKLVMKHGKADEAIASVVELEGADLVVMSAHGYGALKRMLFGSTASRLLRMSNVPVIAVRYKALQKLAKPIHRGRVARRATARKSVHKTVRVRSATKAKRRR